MRRLSVPLMTLVLLLATGALYWQSGGHQRLPEDRLVVWSNPAVTGESAASALLGRFHDSSRDGWRSAVRPVSTLAMRAEWSWFHQERSGFQRMQMVRLALAGILFFFLLRIRLRSNWMALMGGLLLVAHPLATGSVLTLAGVAELLALAFLFLAFLLLQPLAVNLRASIRKDPAGRAGDVGAVASALPAGICFLLAFWSHELATAAVPVLAVWLCATLRAGWLGSIRPGKEITRVTASGVIDYESSGVDEGTSGRSVPSPNIPTTPPARLAVLTAAAALVVFLVHRLISYGLLPEHLERGHAVLVTTGQGWIDRVWLGLQAGPVVLGQFLFPAKLGYTHDHLIHAGPGMAGAAIGLVLLAGLGVIMVLGVRRGRPSLAMWAGWALFFLLGALGFAANPGDIAPVRLVFMALPGLIGLVLIAVQAAIKRVEQPALGWVLFAVGVAVCVLLGLRTVSRAADFENEESLIQAQLRDFPKSAQAHFDMGNFYLSRRQWTGAVAEYEEALGLRPEFPMAWTNLGNAYFGQEEVGLAFRSFMRAISETTGRPEFAVVEARAEYNRALILMQQNRNDEAVAAFSRMLENFPDHLPSHANLGFIYANSPAFEAQALYHLNRALELENDPGRRTLLEDYMERIARRREVLEMQEGEGPVPGGGLDYEQGIPGEEGESEETEEP